MDELPLFPSDMLQPDYQQLYLAVARQIEKDFYPFVAMQAPPEILTSTWLFLELERMLTEIVERQNQSLAAIVYRVDLTEKMVRRSMHSSSNSERMHELTALVLKREAQKVWIRHNYRE